MEKDEELIKALKQSAEDASQKIQTRVSSNVHIDSAAPPFANPTSVVPEQPLVVPEEEVTEKYKKMMVPRSLLLGLTASFILMLLSAKVYGLLFGHEAEAWLMLFLTLPIFFVGLVIVMAVIGNLLMEQAYKAKLRSGGKN